LTSRGAGHSKGGKNTLFFMREGGVLRSAKEFCAEDVGVESLPGGKKNPNFTGLGSVFEWGGRGGRTLEIRFLFVGREGGGKVTP